MKHRLPLDQLTPAEVDVLRLLVTGLTNQEIADARGCSRHTVRSYVGTIYSKLEVRNRVEAVMKAQRTGLVVA